MRDHRSENAKPHVPSRRRTAVVDLLTVSHTPLPERDISSAAGVGRLSVSGLAVEVADHVGASFGDQPLRGQIGAGCL
jgi:hypothetical protein